MSHVSRMATDTLPESKNLKITTLDEEEKAATPRANPSHRIHFVLSIATYATIVEEIIK